METAKDPEELLRRFSVPFQQVIRLIDIEGMDFKEAADILGLPLGTIKSRITHAPKDTPMDV